MAERPDLLAILVEPTMLRIPTYSPSLAVRDDWKHILSWFPRRFLVTCVSLVIYPARL